MYILLIHIFYHTHANIYGIFERYKDVKHNQDLMISQNGYLFLSGWNKTISRPPRRLKETLKDVLKTLLRRFGKQEIVTLKTFSWKFLIQDVFKLSSPRWMFAVVGVGANCRNFQRYIKVLTPTLMLQRNLKGARNEYKY